MNTIPDSHKDLLTTDVAMLATVGQDGYPQVTALWFLFDDDGMVKLSLSPDRQKTKNLGEHPECTFFVLDRANPFRTLEIRADATVTPDENYVFATKLGQKYGADLRAWDGPNGQRVVVTLQPTKVNTYGPPADAAGAEA